MGRQLNFFLSHVDAEVLDQGLRQDEETLILESRSRGPCPEVVDSIRDTESQKIFFYLVRKGDIELVRMKEVPTQGYWRIDEDRSPVVELTKSFIDPDLIRRGRLYYTEAYFDQTGTATAKDPKFLRWAESLLTLAKRILTFDKDLHSYVGPDAQRLRDEGVRFTEF